MIDTIADAKSSTIRCSISEIAKADPLKPYDYFEYLLTEIPKHMGGKNLDFCEDFCRSRLYCRRNTGNNLAFLGKDQYSIFKEQVFITLVIFFHKI